MIRDSDWEPCEYVSIAKSEEGKIRFGAWEVLEERKNGKL